MHAILSVLKVVLKHYHRVKMDKKGGFQERRYLQFVRSSEQNGIDGKPMLNRYSTHLTREHDFPGAQVSMY